MLTPEERYREVLAEAEQAFSTDMQYLIDMAKISFRVASKRG